jgi:uncharacterized membrane protein (UPF0127 family)
MIRPPGRAAILLLLLMAACGGGGDDLPLATLSLEDGPEAVELEVRVAEEPGDRARGLMGVEDLGELEGMVFLADEPARGTFTMRDTLIPLSLGVWGADRRLAAIVDMEPCRAEPCPTYDPGVVWTGAVEVNRGFFERHGIGVGARVRLER